MVCLLLRCSLQIDSLPRSQLAMKRELHRNSTGMRATQLQHRSLRNIVSLCPLHIKLLALDVAYVKVMTLMSWQVSSSWSSQLRISPTTCCHHSAIPKTSWTVSDGLPTVRYTLRGSPMVWSSCRAETEPLVCSYWILQERSRETGNLVSMSLHRRGRTCTWIRTD